MGRGDKVLFAHGLESGPHGKKVKELRNAGMTVVARKMPCDRASWLRDPLVAAFLTASVVSCAAAWWLFGYTALLVAAMVCAVAFQQCKHLFVRSVLSRCVDVQIAALKENPDVGVLIGSSFGGAVALELVRRGLWTGPTLLLAPAQYMVGRRAKQMPVVNKLSEELVIVHGTADTTIPIQDSRDLVQQIHSDRCTLVEVADDHRLSKHGTAKHLKNWIALCLREAQ